MDSPRIVRITEPVCARFAASKDVTNGTLNDRTAVILPTKLPVVTPTEAVEPCAEAALQVTLLSPTHLEVSQPFSPKIVRLGPPVTAKFCPWLILADGTSNVISHDLLPTFRPAVTETTRLQPVPPAARQCIVESESHRVAVQDVKPKRATAEGTESPKAWPTTVTVRDPVPAALCLAVALVIGASKDRNRDALPPWLPTVKTIFLVPAVPDPRRQRMVLVESQRVDSHDEIPYLDA
eukprot:2920235-Rhodomonas_salina.2